MKRTVIAALILSTCAGLAQTAQTIEWQDIIELGKPQGPLAKHTIERGSFTIPSTVHGNPTVTVHWAKPGTSQGLPTRASTAVYYWHFPGQSKFMESPLCRDLVEESGFTVFGVFFTKMTPDVYWDRQKFYPFAESGSFLTVKQAWEELQRQIQQPDRPFFLTGISAGSIASQRFSEEYPELCGAVSLIGGHTFVQKRHAHCPFLLTESSTQHEGSRLIRGLEVYCRNRGNPAILLTLPVNWDKRIVGNMKLVHGLPGFSPLTQRWMEALADMRDEAIDGTMPPGEKWPYQMSSADWRAIWPSESPAWKEGIAATGGDPVAIPSARFYAELMMQAPPTRKVTITSFGEALVARPPYTVKPTDVLLLRERVAGENSDSGQIAGELGVDIRYWLEFRQLVGAPLDLAIPIIDLYKEVIRNEPGADDLPVRMLVTNPNLADLQEVAQLNRLDGCLVVVEAGAVDLVALEPGFKAIQQRNAMFRVLVVANDQDAYDTALSGLTVSDVLSFSAIITRGMSIGEGGESATRATSPIIRQHVLDAAVAFLGLTK